MQFCPYGFTNVCYTPSGFCYMPVPVCRGTPCWCPSAWGPIYGTAN